MNNLANYELKFQGTPFHPVVESGSVWLTSTELAQALDYSSAKSISNLFLRNQDEFTSGMSLVIDMMTNGINGSTRRKKIRVFSLRGAHLIAMFAETPIAKQFRRWVLDVLDRESSKQDASPLFSGKVLLRFENGNLSSAQVAKEDEELISMKTMVELLNMRGYITMTKGELAQKVAGAIKNLQ